MAMILKYFNRHYLFISCLSRVSPATKSHFLNGETTCHQLSKILPDNSTIFAAEATAISLALNYYKHMDPVHHNVMVYFDSMSCLQAGNWGWRHRESVLALTEMKCGPTSKRYPRPRCRPTGKCPLYRLKATSQLHSTVCSNQVGCSCTWQKPLSYEANIRDTK